MTDNKAEVQGYLFILPRYPRAVSPRGVKRYGRGSDLNEASRPLMDIYMQLIRDGIRGVILFVLSL